MIWGMDENAELDWLRNEIASTKETVRTRWIDMAELPGTREMRAAIRAEIDGLNEYLATLRTRLDELDRQQKYRDEALF